MTDDPKEREDKKAETDQSPPMKGGTGYVPKFIEDTDSSHHYTVIVGGVRPPKKP